MAHGFGAYSYLDEIGMAQNLCKFQPSWKYEK